MGQTDTDLRPTALVPVLELGLQKFDALNNLSVDASQVNPVKKGTAKQVGRLAMGKAESKSLVRTRLR